MKPIIATNKCKRCQKDKPVTDFTPSATTPDGLQSWCTECISLYTKLSAEAKNKGLGGVKFCRKCHEIKPRTEFYPSMTHKDGLQTHCKAFDKEHGRLRNGTTGEYRDIHEELNKYSSRQLADELKLRGYEGNLKKVEELII